MATHYIHDDREIALFLHAAKLGLPVLIKGPTGCGKTRFIEHMAQTLDRQLYTVACHDDLTATDLVGRHLIGPNGTYWQDGPLTRAVREGGICYLDEIVEARKDTTVVLHPLADHRRMLPIDRTGETLIAHRDFMLVVSYNPGYQQTFKGLKPSTRQRFVTLSFDYPDLEREVAIVEQESGVDTAIATQLVQLAHDLRRLENCELEESVSTRLIIYAAMLIKAGLPSKEVCNSCLAQPLTDDAETLKAIRRLIDVNMA